MYSVKAGIAGVLSVAFALSGCALFDPNTALTSASPSGPTLASASRDDAPTTIAITPHATERASSNVEILWEVPSIPVDRFIIHHGTAVNDLTQTITLDANALTSIQDPTHGTVYRHVLRNLPRDQSVFVTVTAQSGTMLSHPTEIVEIKP